MMEKLCSLCRTFKPADTDHFYAKGVGLHAYCIPCHNRRARALYYGAERRGPGRPKKKENTL